jgi:hypothetical protein
MNEQILIAELQKPEYTGLSDQEAADAINAKTATIRRPVPAPMIRLRAMSLGMYAVVKIAAEDKSLPNPPRGAAINFITLADSQDTVDLDHPDVATNAGTLRQFSLASQEQIDAINSLGNVVIPWTAANDLPEVGIGLVINARKAITNGE